MGTQDAARESLARALVMLSRYTVDITEIAAQSFGGHDMENRDIQMVLAVHRAGPMTPTQMAESMGAPRSTVSRAMNRLEAAGLALRVQDERDRRSVRISLTPKGRRRVTAFATRLGDYFVHGEPMLKETFHLLGADLPNPDPMAPAEPLVAGEAMTRAGAGYVAEAAEALRPHGVRDFADRFTLALVHLNGFERPTQIADELGLTPSGTSGVLARLEQAGLLTRRHDLTPGDRRAVVVALTPRGEEVADLQLDVFARHAHTLAQALTRTWHARP
jgi:DNA-binding MarR family transcriptional regulator